MKIALAQLNPIMGDLEGNAQRIRNTALSSGADIVVFSEMTITGYPPEDMVLKPLFQKESMRIARQLAEDLADGPAVLVGALWEEEGKPLNVALLMEGGEIRTMQRKYDLPNYGVFDEKRVFAAGGLPQPLEFHGHKIGLMICEDMWNIKTAEALKGVDILLSMHASPFEIGKRDLRRKRARQAVERAGAPIVYVNQIGGQDDLVFDGGSFVLDKDGNEVLAMVECAEAVSCVVFENGQLQAEDVSSPRCSELESTYRVLMCGLRDYVEKNNFPGVILGLSGGIDSALSAAIAVDALGEERVRAYMLPSHYTSEESL
ncbi:MAG: hypothetical protein KDD76_02815, partial [Rickettsiales bacterium]|nr:hypothetical protein [Rickettsiales bacterium]